MSGLLSSFLMFGRAKAMDFRRSSLQLADEEKRWKVNEQQQRVPRVGDVVIWHEATGTPHKALVTAVWTPTCINVVFISGDESKTDPYGRQIERATSCTYKTTQQVHGFYWRFEDEDPNPYVPPLEQ